MQNSTQKILKSETNILEIRGPAFCCIGVSTKCIAKCKMCNVWKSDYAKSAQEPALNEWHSFIERLADFTHGSIELNLAGGEPLLDERNLSLAGFGAKCGLFTSIPTNALLIDKDMADKIADSGLDFIGISLDSINRNTHDFLRGVEGSYDKIMQGIDYLGKYCGNVTLGIQTVILEQNLDEIIGLTEWVNAHKRIKNIIFQAMGQPFNTPFDSEWYKKSEYGFLWPKDTRKVQATIDELIRLKNAGFKISNPNSQLEVFKNYFMNPEGFIKKTKCNVGYHYMNINQFGDVFLCLRKGSIGNIKRHSPQELWCSHGAEQVREEMSACKSNCHHLINCCYQEER